MMQLNDTVRAQVEGRPLPCPREQDHDWRPTPFGGGGTRIYECRKCGSEEERDVL